MENQETQNVEKKETKELTIKFSRKLARPFTGKDGKEFVAISIPNADESDKRPWEEFVLPVERVPLVLGLGDLCGMSDDDGAEWDDMFWCFHYVSNGLGTLFIGIKARPHSTKSEGIGCQQDVFCGSRAVLYPESLPRSRQSFLHIATYNDG